MTTSNHAVTGALIALVIKEPAAVIPLAFASHFVLDALPHFGNNDSRVSAKKRLQSYVRFELAGIIGIALLAVSGVYGWNLVLLASLLAASPDTVWLYRYARYHRKGREPAMSLPSRIHKKIQWCERTWGVYVEVPYFMLCYTLLLLLSHNS